MSAAVPRIGVGVANSRQILQVNLNFLLFACNLGRFDASVLSLSHSLAYTAQRARDTSNGWRLKYGIFIAVYKSRSHGMCLTTKRFDSFSFSITLQCQVWLVEPRSGKAIALMRNRLLGRIFKRTRVRDNLISGNLEDEVERVASHGASTRQSAAGTTRRCEAARCSSPRVNENCSSLSTPKP